MRLEAGPGRSSLGVCIYHMTSAFYLFQVIYFLHARLGQSALHALSQIITPTCLQGRYYSGSAMGKLRVITWEFLYCTESTW